MFRAFKVGEARYAFPLAAGIAESLRAQCKEGFDAIVPVPLSPDKALAGEMDRTAQLATELSRLIGVPVQSHLTLAGAISKRRMENQGFTSTEFQQRYRQLLVIDPAIALARKILLVDDVITRGTTLAVITSAIKTLAPNVEIVCAAAGQMVIKAAVADDRGPGW